MQTACVGMEAGKDVIRAVPTLLPELILVLVLAFVFIFSICIWFFGRGGLCNAAGWLRLQVRDLAHPFSQVLTRRVF